MKKPFVPKDIYDVAAHYTTKELTFGEDRHFGNYMGNNTVHYQYIFLHGKRIGWIKTVEYYSPLKPLRETFWIALNPDAGQGEENRFFGEVVDEEQQGIEFAYLEEMLEFYDKYMWNIIPYMRLNYKRTENLISKKEYENEIQKLHEIDNNKKEEE